MGSGRVLIGIGLLLLLCCIPGCAGGGRSASLPATEPPGDVPAPLPPPSTLHGASALQQVLFLKGKQFSVGLAHQRIMRVNDELVFSPDWAPAGGQFAGLAYATYQFNFVSYSLNPPIRLTWTKSGALSDGWVALADFAADRWDWQQLPSDGRLAYDRQRNVSAAGAMFVVILVSGTKEWRLKQLSISDNWSMFGHDAQHTRQAPFNGPATNALRWSFRTTGAGFGFEDPLVGPDGTVYVGSGPELHALNPDGTVKWHSVACNPSSKPALGADGTLYVGGNNGYLYSAQPGRQPEVGIHRQERRVCPGDRRGRHGVCRQL